MATKKTTDNTTKSNAEKASTSTTKSSTSAAKKTTAKKPTTRKPAAKKTAAKAGSGKSVSSSGGSKPKTASKPVTKKSTKKSVTTFEPLLCPITKKLTEELTTEDIKKAGYDLYSLTELKEHLKPLTNHERTTLKSNILNDGIVRDSLVITFGVLYVDGVEKMKGFFIVDGHNRYSIVQEAKAHGGIELAFKMLCRNFETIEEVKLWMEDNNAGRRNMTKSELAEHVAVRMGELSKGQGGARKNSGRKSKVQSEPLKTTTTTTETTVTVELTAAEKVAKENNMSTSTAKRTAQDGKKIKYLRGKGDTDFIALYDKGVLNRGDLQARYDFVKGGGDVSEKYVRQPPKIDFSAKKDVTAWEAASKDVGSVVIVDVFSEDKDGRSVISGGVSKNVTYLERYYVSGKEAARFIEQRKSMLEDHSTGVTSVTVEYKDLITKMARNLASKGAAYTVTYKAQ